MTNNNIRNLLPLNHKDKLLISKHYKCLIPKGMRKCRNNLFNKKQDGSLKLSFKLKLICKILHMGIQIIKILIKLYHHFILDCIF